MAYQPIEPVGLGRNVANEMMKGGPRLQQEIKTMGPDTIKMIALQQIADQEKQRAMQANMQAQPNPATVMQQVEQEVMQMAQPQQPAGMPMMRDRVPQVGGVLAQKQRMQQQNMQRAGRPQPRPQQPPVRAAMGGLMTQAAPNIDPRYFESGGIVAFANGNKVRGYFDGGAIAQKLGISLEELNKRIADLEARGMSPERARQIQEQAATVPEARKSTSMTEAYRQKLGMPEEVEEVTELTGEVILPGTQFTKADEPKGGLADLLPGAETIAKGMPQLTPRMEEAFRRLPPEEVEVEKEEVIVKPAFEKSDPIAMPKFDPIAGPGSATAKLKEGLGQLIDRDATKANEEGIAAYKEAMALPEEMQTERKQIMERRRKEAFEPERPSKISTIASMFASAANRGSLGSIGAGMVKTANNIERAAKENNKAAFDKYSEEFEKEMQRTQEIGKGALEYGRSLSAEDRADIRAGLSAMQGLSSTEMKIDSDRQLQALKVALQNAETDSRERIALASNETAQEANRLREEGNRLTREGRSLDALDRLEANITIKMAAAAAKIAESYTFRVQSLQSAADSADAEAAEEAQTQLTKLQEQIQLEQDAVMAPLQELLEEYSSRRASMTGAGADEVKTLLQKYKAQ